ncbi:MAG: SurA N-terminal domain-containing protein [Pseudomonadota bacterium]
MLTLIRQLLRSKIFGGIVFGLVIISMAVWGTGDIFSGGLGENVISAGERGIDQETLNRRFDSTLRRIRREQQVNLTQKKALEQGLLDSVIAGEGTDLSLLAYARALGADASDEALVKFIKEAEVFTDPTTGQFSNLYFERVVSAERTSKKNLEEDIRDDLTSQYMIDAVQAATSTPAVLARVEAARLAEQRRVAWFTLKQEFLPEAPPPSEEDAKAYFDQNIENYRIPERRNLAIVAISPQAFADKIEVAEEDILEVYEAGKARRFAQPQKRVITEAVFSNKVSADAAYGVLAGGGSIEGSNGLVSLNQLQLEKTQYPNAEIAEVVFSDGSFISSIFGPYTEGGNYLIIRIDDIIPGDPIPLNDAIRTQISRELALEEAQDVFNQAYGDIDNLIGLRLSPDEMAERLGVDVIRPEPIDRNFRTPTGRLANELQPYQEGIVQAFDELFEGETGDRLEARDAAYLVTLESIVPSTLSEFEDVKDVVIARLTSERLDSGFEETGIAIEARLNGGESTLESEAASFNSEVRRPVITQREYSTPTADLPPAALDRIFLGDEGDFIVAPGIAADERVIIRLVSINAPTPEELDVLAPDAVEALQNSLDGDLIAAYSQALLDAYPAVQDVSAINAYKARIESGQ